MLDNILHIHSISIIFKNYFIISTTMTTICGIDEAGRGPVIGPLVTAGVMVDEKDLEKLKGIGVKDSKLLTPIQREQMFDEVSKYPNHIVVTEPQEIDEALESEELNLNWLEAHKTAEIINELKPDKAIVDCPSTNIEAYKEYLQKLLKTKTELIVEHKADLNHPQAAAASILAKVTRDREIEEIKKKYGDCGPGYPSNEITQKFLIENWEKYPEIFRKSWSSYKKIAQEQFQSSIADFDPEA
tara:strand:- start:601 stop:1329 length:729 start_codon:yes stop_codon:yes gene_type:complete